MALALCLTLLPTAALAEETEGTVQTPPVVEEPADPANGETKQENQPVEQGEQQEDSAAKQAVADVQAMIDALPDAAELDGMDDEDAMAVYEAFQTACDAYYDTLTEEQQAQLKNTEKLAALSDWLSQPETLAESGYIYPDTVDAAEGNIIRHTSWRRSGPIYEGSQDDAAFTDDKFYVIKKDTSVTIQGNLTVGGSCALILCQGAKLTVEGALICNGNYSIYGQSDKGNNAGQLVIKNSKGGGAAIRSSENGAPTLSIYSGELEIHSGNSDKLVDGVKLSSTNHIHQGTLDGTARSPAEWGVTSLKGGTLTLAYCTHDNATYEPANQTQHTKNCPDCGFVGTAVACGNSSIGYVSDGANGHYQKCPCGNKFGNVIEHTIEPAPTNDGKKHTSMCGACGYTPESGREAEHSYDENGKCTVCLFQPILQGANGNLYDDLATALYGGETALTLVSYATENANKDIVRANLKFDTDANITLDMGGCTLENSRGDATVTVARGTLTVKGDATINQTGGHETAAPAVEVTGGTLIFEGKLTATGASGNPAVKVTSGTLRLKAGDVLNGGVSVKGSTAYANVNALLGEKLAFAKEDELTIIVVKGNVTSIDENVVVKAHKHNSFTLGVDGKYTCICGYTCPHNDFKDGKCTICGNGCAHTDVDENGVCENCKTQMVAKIEVGDKTTYTTDLGTTLYKAADGTKITLLANAAVGNVVLQGKTVTLDLNGKTVKDSGGGFQPIQIGPSNSPATLTITGSGSFTSGFQTLVVANGTLDLSQWTGDDSYIRNVTISGANSRFISPAGAGKIDRLAFTGSDTVQAADTASLNGGRYDEIAYRRSKTIKLGDLLAEGYAFRQNGTFLEYAKELKNKDTVKKVEVVKCPHPDAKDGKCLYCGKDGILARVGDTTYSSVSDAVAAWRANGGTLKLFADYGQGADGNDLDLSSASAEWLTIDLNGHGFYKDCKINTSIKLSGGKALTITDSSGKGTGIFGPIDADRGTLTLESGHLDGLTVSSDSSATILLKGGKVSALACPVPVFNLLGNGYCLMSGNITVDPTTILNSGTGTYTIKNPQPLITADKKNGSSSKGERKIPFTLSLKANDSEVGRMQFKWYFIKEDGTTALLAESGDVTATTNDVFTYDATTQSKVAAGWDDTDLKVRDKPYDVICVVTGKDSNGAYLWQTPRRGYKLTIEQTDLKDLKLEFTQVEDTSGFAGPFKGNIKDGKGTFVFEPYGGDVGDASTLTYCFEVYLDGQELEKGKDYIIVDKSNEAKYAGAHTLTIQGMGDYKGTATHTWRIEPYQLTRENYDPPTITKVYDGTTGFDFSKDGNWGSFKENVANRPNDAGTGKNPALGADGNAISIYLKPEDLKASAVTLDSPDVGDRTASYTITLKAREGQSEPNFAFEDDGSPTRQVTAPAYITKAFLSSLPEAGELNVANDHAGVYTLDLSKLLPKLESPKEYGAVTYGAPTVNLSSGYYAVSTATIENGKLILPIKAVETKETGSIGSVKVKVSTTNYHDFTLTINVNATNKIVPIGAPTLSKTTLAWGEQLSTITLSGTMTDPTDSTKTVKGKFEWVAPGAAKEKIGEYEAAWKFTPDEDALYTEATGTVKLTVTKATPKGAPKYTAINASGKTLKDATLTVGTIQPEGAIQWELVDTTVVTANTAYKWVFTPKDKEHYDVLTGFVTPYSVSSNTGGSSSGGGGGGSSSSSKPSTSTGTTTKPDGTKVETVTKPDGTTIKTETKKDGSVSKTETKPDGSSVTETKAADGSTGTVKTDKNGQTTAETALSSKAVEDAKKNGEPVTAPVEVKATRNSDTAPTVKVELPKNAGETEVEIPVSNAKPGTVAVLVHPDGTEEILKASVPTENGIRLTVDGSATVKIVDNSKGFIDTQDHWAKDAIDFVSARGLVNGMSATIYAPNNSTTRAQLWTILARQNDADLNGGSVWYEKAQLWSKDKGISDGTNPNGTINRAQMVTMLWRTMGQPAAGGSASFADVPADSYYAQAVAWAIENGITAGVGGGRFAPNSTCTRAQIATFLARSMK